jgi:hypothetical protein
MEEQTDTCEMIQLTLIGKSIADCRKLLFCEEGKDIRLET